MTTIAQVQADLAKAQADLTVLSADVNAASAQAQKLVTDLNTIATDLALLVPTPPTPPSGGMTAPPGFTHLVLDDTFANLNNWNTFYGPGVRWDNHGALPAPYSGGNMPGANDAALYSPAFIVVGGPGGGVTLKATPGGGPFASQGYTWQSGCLTSKAPMPGGEWYVQIKAKRPDTSAGMWPADWFLPANDAQELDGYEGGFTPGNANQQGHSTVFAATGTSGNIWQTGVDLSAAFHVYGYHFKSGPAGGFTIYFDGRTMWQYLGNLTQQAYYLFLQLQVAAPQTSSWHTTGGTTPQSSEYAEVQIWTP
jgi:hypothetical protein